jgi:hypothetical protein
MHSDLAEQAKHFVEVPAKPSRAHRRARRRGRPMIRNS